MLYCSEANDQTEAVLISKTGVKNAKVKVHNFNSGILSLVLSFREADFVRVDTILFCQQQGELCTMAPHSSKRLDVT